MAGMMTASPILSAENTVGGFDPVDGGPGPRLRIAYRRQLLKALRIKWRRGEITREEYRKFWRASWNSDFLDSFIDEIINAAKVAGSFIDNVKVWIRALANWLIENWPTVLKILLSLMVFI